MSKYFDKDFFRFFLGFVSILCTSLIILFVFRIYQENSLMNGDNNAGAIIKSLER